MKLISNLKVVHRFGLIGVVALTLAAIPASLHVNQAYGLMKVAQRELDGIAPVRTLVKAVQLTQLHRVQATLGDDPGARAQRQAAFKDADAAHGAVAAIKPQLQDAATLAALDKVVQDWASLRAAFSSGGPVPTDSFARHSALVVAMLDLLDLVTDDFGLSLDPEASTYHLIRSVMAELPVAAEELAQTRGIGSAVLSRGSRDDESARALAGHLARAGEAIRGQTSSFAKAASADASVKSRLEAVETQTATQVRQALALARQQVLTAEKLTGSAEAFRAAMTVAVDAQVALNDKALLVIGSLLEERVGAMKQGLLGMVAAMLAMAVVGLGLGWVAGRSIIRELGGEPAEVVAVANAVAQGDLTSRIHVRPGDATSIVASLERVQTNLAKVVGAVRGNADSVAAASSQIANGNQDLSQRTEEQASALEEAAASMEELGTTVRQNADHARHANELARDAASVAGKGGEMVTQVVDRMTGIQDSSRKIADIIGVIDGIAFQTNILALNAAVEAARAGEQGRGFSVVAGEVRALAQRCAGAAREVKVLIDSSVEQVQQGSALVGQAGRTMQDIVGAIERVSVVVGEISAASAEQSTGVNQVSEAVAQMDQVTQQNAALVEQSAAAADSLRKQAVELVGAVAVFKLDPQALVGEPVVAAPAARVAAPARATNVAPLRRPQPKLAAAAKAADRTGTDDWSTF